MAIIYHLLAGQDLFHAHSLCLSCPPPPTNPFRLDRMCDNAAKACAAQGPLPCRLLQPSISMAAHMPNNYLFDAPAAATFWIKNVPAHRNNWIGLLRVSEKVCSCPSTNGASSSESQLPHLQSIRFHTTDMCQSEQKPEQGNNLRSDWT